MDSVKPHPTLQHNEHAHSTLEANEKGNVYNINDVDSSQLSTPGGDFDELPDPDAGKSDEERARLVRPSLLLDLVTTC
jgi:hypothetical protein